MLSLVEHDVGARVAQACYGLTFYLWKTVLPVGLGPLYQIPPRDVLMGFMFGKSALLLAILVGVAIGVRRSVPGVAAALAVYAIVLAPVLGLTQSGPQLVADRYSYLSCLGFAVLIGGWMLRSFRRDSWWAAHGRRAGLALFVAGVTAALYFLTSAQATVWDQPISLWDHGVRVSPNSSIAHVNLADALAEGGYHDAAIVQYQQGLTLDPEDEIAHDHLARVLRAVGLREGAIAGFTEAIRLDPHRPGAHQALAELWIGQGDGAEAVRVLHEGMRDNPNDLGVIDMLAQLLAAHPDDGVRNGDEAVNLAQYVNAQRDRRHASALTTLATAYAEVGRFAEAIETAETALELARRKGDERLASTLERRLVLFRNHEPFRYTVPKITPDAPADP